MRLICPNCGAQYEVAEDVIPEGGRDVQCSNCGHTWFEGRGASEAAEAEEMARLAADAPKADPVPEPAPEPEPEVEPVAAIEETAEPEPAPLPDETADADVAGETETAAPMVPDRPYSGSIKDAFGDVTPPEHDEISEQVTADFDDDEPPLVTTPPRRAVDASIAGILREEAARETAARRKDSDGGLETQSELGLPDIEKRRVEPAKPALIQGISETMQNTTAAAVAETVAAASRKELLPDIEEINSSLRSNAERGESTIPDPEELIEAERRGFRFGFVSVMMVIFALTLIYVFAPQITEYVPVLSGVLQGFVDLVDAGRLWLDLKMQGMLESMQAADATSG